ncbi:Titin [Araneus ventricosus]|uniref:Titin n=1 Tax=Araneus ventricosus TaxID=182803 RepID=A0A4Y2A9L5_ARAVE|nr:Titin [Araneus ventricosus]
MMFYQRPKLKGNKSVAVALFISSNMKILNRCVLYVLVSTVYYIAAVPAEESPKIQSVQIPQIMEIGEKISIPCLVSKGTPPFKFEWYKNSAALKNKENIKIDGTTDSSRLTINPVNEKSSGNYTCVVHTKHGSARYTTIMSVKAPPVWTSEPKDIEVTDGETAVLQCAAEGSPFPQITWKRLDKEEPFMNFRRMKETLLNGSISFTPVNKSYEGSYVCEANNNVGLPLKKIVSLIVHEFPKIQRFQFPQDIQIGYKINIMCAIMQGGSPISFAWYKNGRILKETANIHVESNEKLSTLTFDPVEDTSVGNYTCVVSNPHGKDNHTAFLSVRAPPSWIKEPEDTESIEGENVNIYCIVTGSPYPNIRIWKLEIPKIQPFQFPSQIKRGDIANLMCSLARGSLPVRFTWIKDGKPIENRQTVNIVSNEGFSNLVIKSVDETSVGNYTCIVSSSFGSDNFTAQLKVKVPPSWIKEPTDVETIEGHKAAFICFASGSPTPRIWWRKLGKEVIQKTKFHQNDANGSLSFNPTSKEDEGSYECKVENGIGEILTKIVQLVVHERPSIQPFQFPQNIQLGDKATVICSTRRSQSSTVYEWYKDNHLLKKSTNVNIDSNEMYSTLIIDPVEDTSVGNYTCLAKNKFGQDSNSAFLFVRTPPFWLKEPDSLQSVEGQAVNVSCSAGGYPLPQISIKKEGSKAKIQPFYFPQKVREGESTKVICTVNAEDKTFSFKWLKDGVHLKSADRIEISALADYSLLKIKSVSFQDSGNYTCTAFSGQNVLNYTTTLLVEAPVQWVSEPTDEEVILGESVKFSCSAKGYPKPSIKWGKIIGEQEYQLETHTRFRIDNEGNFGISNVQSEDAATYICHARNGVGDALHKKVSLSVIDAPEILPLQQSTQLKIGDNANFVCSVARGQAPLSFKWYKNGQLIKNYSKETSGSEKFSLLAIDPITVSSAGNYTCVVSNTYGKSSSSTLLIVKSPPYWIKEPEDVETTEGSRVTLLCHAGGTPQPRITWKILGEIQSQDYSMYVAGQQSDANGTLTLNPVKKEHEGVYICEVNNDVDEKLTKQASVVVHDAPKINPFHFPAIVEIQEKASVACILKHGQPPLEFKWFKNNQELHDSKNVKIKSLDDVSIITIEPVSSKDSGNYTCLVSNSFGKDTHAALLAVEAPPRWLTEPVDVEIMEGEKASLICAAEGQPTPRYTWKKLEDNGNILLSSVKEGNLTFQRVTIENAGRYSCEVENGVGRALRKIANLIIHDHPPKIQPFSVSDVLNEGESAKLGCVVIKGDGPFTFKWYRDNKEIKSDSQFEIDNLKGVSTLTVKSVSGYTSGNYTCEAQNAAGKDSYSASLVVNAPPKWVNEPASVEGLAGSFIILDCQVSGYPPPTVTWIKQNDAEEMQKVMSVVKNGSLIFHKLLAEDEGEYLCKAQNNVGATLQKFVTVSVLGK